MGFRPLSVPHLLHFLLPTAFMLHTRLGFALAVLATLGLELDKVESHLHLEGSFDVAAHPAPTGREEQPWIGPSTRRPDL